MSGKRGKQAENPIPARIIHLAEVGSRIHDEAGNDEMKMMDTTNMALFLINLELGTVPLPQIIQHAISMGRALEGDYRKTSIIRPGSLQ
jgi:hypothetical protein